MRVKTCVYSHGHMIQPGRANLHRSFPKHPFSLREFLPQLLLLTNHAVSEMQGKRDDPENSPEIVVQINAVAYCMRGKCKVYILCCSMFSMLFIHPTSQNTHVTRNISEYNILIYMYCIYIYIKYNSNTLSSFEAKKHAKQPKSWGCWACIVGPSVPFRPGGCGNFRAGL